MRRNVSFFVFNIVTGNKVNTYSEEEKLKGFYAIVNKSLPGQSISRRSSDWNGKVSVDFFTDAEIVASPELK